MGQAQTNWRSCTINTRTDRQLYWNTTEWKMTTDMNNKQIIRPLTKEKYGPWRSCRKDIQMDKHGCGTWRTTDIYVNHFPLYVHRANTGVPWGSTGIGWHWTVSRHHASLDLLHSGGAHGSLLYSFYTPLCMRRIVILVKRSASLSPRCGGSEKA